MTLKTNQTAWRQLRDEKGFSLIETAIVLAVIGLVVGGIWIAAAAVQSNFRKQSAQTQVLQVAQNLRNVYKGQANTDGLTNLIAVQTGAVPGDMDLDGAGALQNPFGGDVFIGPATLSTSAGGTNDGFFLEFENVPQDACADLMTKNTTDADNIGLDGMQATAGAGDNAADSDPQDGGALTNNRAGNSFPLTVANALGECTNDDQNTVVWVFSIRG